MRFRGRGIVLVLSVMLMFVWHIYHYIRQPADYYHYAIIQGNIGFEASFTISVLVMAYFLGRQYDKAEIYRQKNTSYARYIRELNQIEKELRESEARYRNLVELSPEPIALYSDGRIVYMNPSGAGMLGASRPEELMDKPVASLVHADDIRQMTEMIQKILEGRLESELTEKRFVKLSGDVIDVEVKAIYTTFGGKPAVQLLCRDITERKQTEEELRRATELLESFFSYTSDAIDVLDLNGNILQVNGAFERMFGWKREEVLGKGIDIIVPPELQEEWKRLQEIICSGDCVNGFETKRMRKNGEMLDISVTISPLRDNKSKIIGIASISRDITERKRVEAALRESEAHYRLIAENMTDMIALLGSDGRAEYVSPSSLAIVGAPPETFIGQELGCWIHPDDREKFETALSSMVADHTGTIVEFRIMHQDGRWVELEATGRIAPDENGSKNKTVVVARNITERKRTDELLRRSEKLTIVGQLAAGVAHEIRNPLTSLKGFLQLLQKRMEGQDYIFNLMLSELERINEIVSEFLVIAKPQVSHFERHNLAQIVRNVVSLLETQAILSNVQIETSFRSSEDIMVNCDENQLKQVFINILKNAVEAMPKGGTVRVSVEMNGDERVRVRFADDGPGIPESCIPRLGEPFYTTKEKGTGLGLMVSFKIIEDHKGSIHIKSSVGAGTVFDILLPACLETFAVPYESY